MVPTDLMAAGSKFQQEEPEKDKTGLVQVYAGFRSCISVRSIVAFPKDRDYVGGTNVLFTLNISTALLKSSCFCNINMLRAFNFSSVYEFLSGSNSLAAWQ